jgi:carbamoyl-phosphate synthase large subunit
MAMNLMFDCSPATVGTFIKLAKKMAKKIVVTDCNEFCIASKLANNFFVVPKASDDNYELFKVHRSILASQKIDLVIPLLQETLLDWATFKFLEFWPVIISPKETIKIFIDKWETYNWFKENNIPTPITELNSGNWQGNKVKPRFGRGGNATGNNTDLIYQEYIEGQEYTTDVLCDKLGSPIYIVPRKRVQVESGISFEGEVVLHNGIVEFVKQICSKIKFIGPINIQCIENDKGIWFTEINPRIGGGLPLSIEATENWFLLFPKILKDKKIKPKNIKYGTRMVRYYNEVYIGG